MKNEHLNATKARIAELMAYRFPKYPIRFESVGEETDVLGVGVFCVPDYDFIHVQDFIFDLQSKVKLPLGWELLPLVRDPSATRKHYPEVLDRWALPRICTYPTEILTGLIRSVQSAPTMPVVDFAAITFSPVSMGSWAPDQRPAPQKPANQEFAVAA
jgi:hypothetical protein